LKWLLHRPTVAGATVTWLVNSWLMNEPYLYDVLQHIIKAFETISEQAEELEHYIREDDNALADETSMWSDLLEAALGRVSWQEIIENN
jgi:hypothetical protein